MKKENYVELNIPVLEDKLQERKLKLMNLRGDMANRKLKNVKEIHIVKKEIARVLTSLSMKKRDEKLASVKETKE